MKKLGKKGRNRECKLWKAGGLDPPVCPHPLHTITTTIVKKKGIVWEKKIIRSLWLKGNNAVLIRLVDIVTK